MPSAEIIEIIAALIGSIATAVGGAAASGIFEQLYKVIKDKILGTSQPPPEPGEKIFYGGSQQSPKPSNPKSTKAKSQVLVRIGDAKTLRTYYFFADRRGRWASNLLIFGQYVIGAAMATSFMKDAMSPKIISVFGLLVVISTVLKQHYHPEVNAQIARQRFDLLDALIRQSEDRLVVIETKMTDGSDDPSDVLELLEKISAELTKINSATKDLGSRQKP